MSLTKQALTLGKRQLRNRWVLPPQVLFHYNHATGMVSEDTINHYRHYAQSGTGMVIVEATCISTAGRLREQQLGLWQDEQIHGHQQLAQAIQDEGAMAIIQIHHAGLKSIGEKVAPSDYQDEHFQGRALSNQEIAEIFQEFVAACARAKTAGYAGVELHAAHGYLLSQFLSVDVNQRADGWGGSAEKRAALVVKLIQTIKTQCGDDFLVTIRMGGNDQDAVHYAQLFAAAGADALHVSYGFKNSVDPAPSGYPSEPIHYCAAQIKAAVNIPVIAVFKITSLEQAELLLSIQSADLIAIGRSALVDPDWFAKVLRDEKPVSCRHCKGCAWHKGLPADCVGRIALQRVEKKAS